MIEGEAAQNIKCATDNVIGSMCAIRNNIIRDNNISERYLREKLEIAEMCIRDIRGWMEDSGR